MSSKKITIIKRYIIEIFSALFYPYSHCPTITLICAHFVVPPIVTPEEG